jgi:hypothetical protein
MSIEAEAAAPILRDRIVDLIAALHGNFDIAVTLKAS